MDMNDSCSNSCREVTSLGGHDSKASQSWARHAPWQMKSLKLLAIAGGCCQHHGMRAFFLHGINLTQGGWHASHASACVLIPWWSFSNPFSNPFSYHFWLPWWRPRENHLGAAEISNVPANAGVAWEELAPPTDSPDGCFGDSAS